VHLAATVSRSSRVTAKDRRRERMKSWLLAGALLVVMAGSAKANAPLVVNAFYDDQLFNITLTELPSGGEVATEAHNGSKNTIYMCDACPFDFVPVLDAIQTDGFNPLWEEVQITFAPNVTPVQFGSDNEINDALANHEISLRDTEEMYTCAVLGPKKK
jgi:hypothetical protein